MRRSVLIFTALSISAWSQPAPAPAQPPTVVKVAEMPPTPQRDFLGYLQSLGPLIAASVAIGVASMQYYLQRQQMKQTLFDKRFEVYTTVEAYFAAVNTDNDESKAKLHERFAMATRRVEFLFGPEVRQFIAAFLALSLERESHLEGDDQWCEATLELTRRVTEGVEQRFRPYLQLHQEQSWLARFIAHFIRWVDQDQPAKLASRYDA